MSTFSSLRGLADPGTPGQGLGFLARLWALCLVLLTGVAGPAMGQIFAPEGLHMPGGWNGYGNYPDPATHFAFRGTTSAPEAAVTGGINQIAGPLSAAGGFNGRWQTTIRVGAGLDVAAGTYPWLFTTGSSGGPFNNKWAGVNVTINTLQTYQFNTGLDNSVTFNNGRVYTVNWRDAGYQNSSAIFMETSAVPVEIFSVNQSPSTATPSDAVIVTVTMAANPSPEERIYIRWSTNSFATSTVTEATFLSGSSYTATIPAQPEGTTVNYYAFTSTVAPGVLTANWDMYTLRFRNAGGTAAFAYTSATAPPVNVTFRVDMANETVGGSVFLAGSFNGFAITGGSAIAMTNTSGTIYEATVPLPQSGTVEYKFVNGSAFENVPGACASGSGNREFTVGTSAVTLPLVCYAVCGACPPQRQTTFRVNMANQPGTTSMNLAGEFNGYSTTATPMTNIGAAVWEVTIPLIEGRSYQYKFVRNGSAFETDLGAPCGTGQNRIYTIPASNSTVPEVCFGSCNPCAPTVGITFQVDLGQAAPNPGGVRLVGSFNGFQSTGPNAIVMTQVGTTSVYRTTLQLSPGDPIQYKFFNDFFEPNPPCAGGSGNREFIVPASATTFPVVCYATCAACPVLVPVTFRVNMTGTTVSPNGLRVVGSFQTPSFDAGSPTMTAVGGGVYERTILVPVGTHVFKYLNNNNFSSGVEPVPSVCGVDDGFGGFNRTITVTAGPAVTLPTVCFSRCIDCGATNVWTGATNTSFTDGRNWTAGVIPTGCGESIRIAAVVNQPQIGTGTVTIGSIEVSPGATLTLSPGVNLDVCGTLTGSGGTIQGGTVRLAGPSAQTIPGSATVSNLTVTNTSGVTINGVMRVLENLTLATGGVSLTVAPAGSVRLVSSATGTARLTPVPAGATLTGNLTQERHLSGGPGWRFVGAPFRTGPTLGTWDGVNLRISPANTANVFEYREPDTTSSRVNGATVNFAGWHVPAALTNPINTAQNPRGYRVYVNQAFFDQGNRLVTTGAPYIGAVSVPYTRSANGWDGGGWNLLANPYPSEIDWRQVRFDPANAGQDISNAITIWNPAIGTQGGYATYTALSSTTGTGAGIATPFIGSSQGFFIKANPTTTGGSLTFTEAHKSNQGATSFVRSGQNADELVMTLRQGAEWDHATAIFHQGALFGQDNFDARNLRGPGVDLALAPLPGLSHAITVLPSPTTACRVPLVIRAQTGTASLELDGLLNFAAGTRIELVDHFTGMVTPIGATATTYAFTVTADPASQVIGRLELVFTPASVTSTTPTITAPALRLAPSPVVAGQMVEVGLLGAARLTGASLPLSVVDLTGRTVYQTTLHPGAGDSLKLSTRALKSGVYSVQVLLPTGVRMTERLVVE